MKNSQKGFIAPLLIGIIALLVIGGGVYIYGNKKVEVPAVVDNTTVQSNQIQQTNTQTPPVNNQQNTPIIQTSSPSNNQQILNNLVTNWKKIAPEIIPGFPPTNQAFYGYPEIIQFIGNNRIVITYADNYNPLFAVLNYDINQKKFSYLDKHGAPDFTVTETLWNTWRNKYGDVSFVPQTYQFSSTRTGDVVYPSDWKLISKNPYFVTKSPIVQPNSSSQTVSVRISIGSMNENVYSLLNNTTVLGLKYLYPRNSGDSVIVNTIDSTLGSMGDSCGAIVQAVLEITNPKIEGTHATLRGDPTVAFDIVRVVSHDTPQRTCAY
ncbi:MAG: hypothetical protein EXS46_00385 [Candidatus Taylorbacteria bacterium]|nr:hypothetical protein [Candidatus Taylorbacteria bacterium]